MTSKHSHRKDEHVSLAVKLANQSTAFADVRIIHQSLPELGLDDIVTEQVFAGKRMAYPILIEAMTGGSEPTGKLNGQLAKLAAIFDLPMAVGSQSVALKEPSLGKTFEIARANNPDGLIFANMGAGHSLDCFQAAIEMVAADAIQLHVNAAQEVVMPEGDTVFKWRDHLSQAVDSLKVPVIVKEVGFGMAKETIADLRDLGVKCIDVSGRGGTNFAEIENYRRSHKDYGMLADWGQTTAESLLERAAVPNAPIAFASGGIQTPLDAIKALALGATYVGLAGTILNQLVTTDFESTRRWLNDWLQAFKKLLLLTGVRKPSDLKQLQLVYTNNLASYMKQRKL